MNVKQWKIHAIAVCDECSFREEHYLKAVKAGRKHAKETGHQITVETGFCRQYNGKN